MAGPGDKERLKRIEEAQIRGLPDLAEEAAKLHELIAQTPGAHPSWQELAQLSRWGADILNRGKAMLLGDKKTK